MLTLLVTFSLAFVLASRLQKPSLIPVLELVEPPKRSQAGVTTRSVLKILNHDEFGLLATEFNGMLGQIERRDLELQQHRESLEEQVARRTGRVAGHQTRN